MRSFIRHPSDIPIEVQIDNSPLESERGLNNISAGGLSFKSDTFIEPGSTVRVRIPLVKPVFESRGKVAWCSEESGHYDIGIEFVQSHDVFKARMVEQVCHIEHYKREIYRNEGRILSGREAALEWISKFANTFQAEPVSK